VIGEILVVAFFSYIAFIFGRALIEEARWLYRARWERVHKERGGNVEAQEEIQ
jgi:hypothetical protein